MADLPTVRELLEHAVLQGGHPDVVAGASQLDRAIRWVHISELPDAASHLEGGEVVLTTGIGLPGDDAGLLRYIDDLSAAGARCLVLELGRRFRRPPRVMVEQAERCGLPFVVLRHEVQFVKVTEAFHGTIVHAQLRQLKQSEQVHHTFTELTVEGATSQRIVQQAARMLDRPIILENVARQVVAFDDVGTDMNLTLGSWERRSRRLRSNDRTAHVTDEGGWLISSVGARGEVWGRLLMPCPAQPEHLQTTVLERAAAALALNRLMDRDRESLEQQSHRSLLDDIRNCSYSSAAEVQLRAQALGVPLTGHWLIGTMVRFLGDAVGDDLERQAARRANGELVTRAAREAGVSALVGPVGSSDAIGALLSLDNGRPDPQLQRFAQSVHRVCASAAPTRRAMIGVGSVVAKVSDARRSFHEAGQVAEAAAGAGTDKLYYALPDVRIRGLLHLLRDDIRLQTFVERELGVLMAHDERHGTDLVRALDAYVAAGCNKSTAAQALGMSRPALYQRLQRIERIMGVDLGSVESCLSIHVALLAHRGSRAVSLSTT